MDAQTIAAYATRPARTRSSSRVSKRILTTSAPTFMRRAAVWRGPYVEGIASTPVDAPV
jgi:hypothetical protein